MLRRLSLGLLGAIVALAGVGASSASAFGPGGYGLGFFNYDMGMYGGNYRIPYYSLFPPVYYSYPVARTYGYSPFAYPPGTITPEGPPQIAPVTYINPLVKPSSGSDAPQAGATLDKSAAAPRMYTNPFVKQRAVQTASTK